MNVCVHTLNPQRCEAFAFSQRKKKDIAEESFLRFYVCFSFTGMQGYEWLENTQAGEKSGLT